MPQILSPVRADVPLLPAPHRKRWTPADCDFLEGSGLLMERYELINGEIAVKMPQNLAHMIVLALLSAWLKSVFGDLRVLGQGTITITDPEGSVHKPEPDIAILREIITHYEGPTLGPDDLLLVVEVSDSTLAYDLQTKSLLYGRAGIREYWIADIVNRRLVVHRQPGARGYQEIAAYTYAENVAPLARPDALLNMADLMLSE